MTASMLQFPICGGRYSDKLKEFGLFANSLRTITNYNKTSYMAKQLEESSSIHAFLDEVMDDVDLVIEENDVFKLNVPNIDIKAKTTFELAEKIAKDRRAMTWLKAKFSD